MADKHTTQLVRDLRAQGYEVTRTRKHHLRVSHPDRPGVVHLPGTPGGNRSRQNTLAVLRRVLGYEPESGVGARR